MSEAEQATTTNQPEQPATHSGAWLIAGVIVVILILLLSFGSGENKPVPLAGFFPADTITYLEIPNCAALENSIATLPIWKRSPERELSHLAVETASRALGDIPFRDLVDLAGSIEQLATATVTNPIGNPVTLTAVQVKSPGAFGQLCNDYKAEDVTFGDMSLKRLKLPDGKLLFAGTLGRVIVLSEDQQVVRTAIGLAAGGEKTTPLRLDSLSGFGVTANKDLPSPLLCGLLRPSKTLQTTVPAESATNNAQQSLNRIMDTLSDDARLVYALYPQSNEPALSINIQIINAAVATENVPAAMAEEEKEGLKTLFAPENRKELKETMGLLDILYGIVIVILCIIGIPVLILAVMAVLGLLIHLRLWWSGNIRPANPEMPLENLSAQIKEDMGSTRRNARRRNDNAIKDRQQEQEARQPEEENQDDEETLRSEQDKYNPYANIDADEAFGSQGDTE